jgi:hypothetical protein
MNIFVNPLILICFFNIYYFQIYKNFKLTMLSINQDEEFEDSATDFMLDKNEENT